MATSVVITVTIRDEFAAALDQTTAQTIANEAAQLVANSLGDNTASASATVVVS